MKDFLCLAALLSRVALAAVNKTGSACVVTPISSPGEASSKTDDTPQILDALKQCGKVGSIAFTEGAYNIGQVMDKLDSAIATYPYTAHLSGRRVMTKRSLGDGRCFY